MVGPTNRKNWLTFGDNRSRIHIPDHFSTSLTIAEYGKFRRFISISTLGEMTDIRQDDESATFWERSGIHPDRNSRSLLLEILTFATVCKPQCK